jgi:hypothetical protein
MNLRKPGLFSDMSTQPFQLWPTLKYLTIPGTVVSVRAPFDGAPSLGLIIFLELYFLRLPGCRRGN